MTIPCNILTTYDYNKILKDKFKTTDVNFLNADWSSISENIEGFLGDHYVLKIKYKLGKNDNEEILFVKTTTAKTQFSKDLLKLFIPYEKEVFFYNYILKELEKIGCDISFAPKAYYCKNFETIVMDNLKENGFQLLNRNRFFDIQQSEAVLRALALYHAGCIVYEETMSKKLTKKYRLSDEYPRIFEEKFFLPNDTGGIGHRYVQISYNTFLKLLDVMPETYEWKKAFEKKIANFDYAKVFWQELPLRKTCAHGDLWSNNMMFKFENNVAIKCCLVDFQLLRYYYPSYDVTLALYYNTKREFRQKHLQELLDYYYNCFSEILNKHGFVASNIMPKKHFLKSVVALTPMAVLQATAGNSLVRLPPELLNKAVNAGGDELNDIFLSKQRVDLVFETFQKNEEYRSVTIDDMYDIYEYF